MCKLITVDHGSPFNSCFMSWKYELPPGVFYKGVSTSYRRLFPVGWENGSAPRILMRCRLRAVVCLCWFFNCVRAVLQAVSVQWRMHLVSMTSSASSSPGKCHNGSDATLWNWSSAFCVLLNVELLLALGTMVHSDQQGKGGGGGSQWWGVIHDSHERLMIHSFGS